MDENKRKALENALKTIEKEFGKGAVMRLGEMPKLQVDVIPTGSLGLDLAPVSYTHLTLPTNREV